MATDTRERSEEVPWQQEVLDSIWLLALAAILYWALVYIVWGIVDILSVPLG